MSKFVYFMAVGLAFTVLQVATVEASHDRAHVDEMRAMEDQTRQTMRETEDQTRQTMRETEDSTLQAAREVEDTARRTAREAEDTALQAAEDAAMAAGGDHPECPEGTDCGPPPCPEGTTCDGPGADPCMGITPQAAQDACYDAASLTGGQHDCSEIPDAAGRALCETAEARGTPPTAAECALVGDPAECLRHAAGGGGDDDVALTIDDPRCIAAPEARDHRCPGFVAP